MTLDRPDMARENLPPSAVSLEILTAYLPRTGNNLMKIQPLGENVVVKRLEAVETTAGGIVLPEAAKEKPAQGRILSVGDGVMLADGSRVAHQVGEGDRVAFSSYSGTEVKIDNQDLLIMSESDILAILD